MTRMTCVSLFSGCGGLDLGLQRVGFRIAVAMDMMENCEQSHAANFPNSLFLRVKGTELTTEKLLGLAKQIGPVDLLAAGPPCPSFSKSRFYRKEKQRALDDANGRETFDAFFRTLRVLRPRAFLLENVKGLTYKVHAEALDELLRESKNLGFKVWYEVLNAADYGVPQIRERCFVVGLREGEFMFPSPSHSKSGLGGLPLWRTAGEVLDELDTPETWGDEGHKAGGRHRKLLELVPPGRNYLHFTAERGHPDPIFRWRSRYWSFLLKLSPDLPSWTIQARRSNNMGPFHWRNRILRISEIKRLQAFPDGFVLCGKVDDQWRQIGNAVPPVLAEALGRQLHVALSSADESLSAPLAAE